MWLKICGLTEIAEDVKVALEPVDAIGFVFFQGSKRYVSPHQARQLGNYYGNNKCKVGVFVNEKPCIIQEIARQAKLDLLQLHGEEKIEDYQHIGLPILKAFRLRDGDMVQDILDYSGDTVLLDAYHPNFYGGTGQLPDLQLIARITKFKKVILAGGLNPENIQTAVTTVQPWGLDVSSGVEINGKKNDGKIRALISNLKSIKLPLV